MPIKGGLFVLILVALAMRTSVPIKRGCSPTGYEEYEPLMTRGGVMTLHDYGYLPPEVLNSYPVSE